MATGGPSPFLRDPDDELEEDMERLSIGESRYGFDPNKPELEDQRFLSDSEGEEETDDERQRFMEAVRNRKDDLDIPWHPSRPNPLAATLSQEQVGVVRFTESRPLRERREPTGRPPRNPRAFPTFIGPINFINQLDNIIDTSKQRIHFAVHARLPSHAPVALEQLVQCMQAFKEMRILYNQCVVRGCPDFYELIDDALSDLEIATQPPYCHDVDNLALTAARCWRALTHCRTNLEPWREMIRDSPDLQQKIATFEQEESQAQDQHRLQTVRPKLKAREPSSEGIHKT